MSEAKKGINLWLIIVILGVVATLFSVYAFQQQHELKETRGAVEMLLDSLAQVRAEARVARARAVQVSIEAKQKQMELNQALQDCEKQKRKK